MIVYVWRCCVIQRKITVISCMVDQFVCIKRFVWAIFMSVKFNISIYKYERIAKVANIIHFNTIDINLVRRSNNILAMHGSIIMLYIEAHPWSQSCKRLSFSFLVSFQLYHYYFEALNSHNVIQ